MGSSREWPEGGGDEDRNASTSRSAIGVSEPRSPREFHIQRQVCWRTRASGSMVGPCSTTRSTIRMPNRQAHHQLATDRVTEENGTLQPACARPGDQTPVSSARFSPWWFFAISEAGQVRRVDAVAWGQGLGEGDHGPARDPKPVHQDYRRSILGRGCVEKRACTLRPPASVHALSSSAVRRPTLLRSR